MPEKGLDYPMEKLLSTTRQWATANQILLSLHPTSHFLALADRRELFG